MGLYLLVRDIVVAAYDSLMGEPRRRYEFAVDIAAPPETVWALLKAREVSFPGMLPLRIVTDRVAGRPELHRLTIHSGTAEVVMMTRLVDERPGRGILFQVLADGTDAVLLDGADDYIGYVVDEVKGGTRLTVTRELSVTSRFGRLTVPMGLRAGALRAKRRAEAIARGEAPLPEPI